MIPNFTNMQVILASFDACSRAREWVGNRDLRTALLECPDYGWMDYLAAEFYFSNWITRDTILKVRETLTIEDARDILLPLIATDTGVITRERGLNKMLIAWYEGQGCETVHWRAHKCPLSVIKDGQQIATYHYQTPFSHTYEIDVPPKPKVFVAYWHDKNGSTPSTSIINTDGDLEELLKDVQRFWLDDLEELSDKKIAEIIDVLREHLEARIPKVFAGVASISIDEFDADDPTVQALIKGE